MARKIRSYTASVKPGGTGGWARARGAFYSCWRRPANSAKVPNPSAQAYDFGDESADPVNGYGSMQVHNHDAKQTLFAVNHWIEGSRADIGIGNQPKGSPDWTFAANAGSYQAKRLRVLVRCKQ